MRIAIIDDEYEIAELVQQTAEAAGWSGLATTDPDEFCRYVAEGADLVVLDLMMPQVDGVEILRRLGAEGCRAGIVLFSGMDRRVLQIAEELAKSLGLKTLGHLEKPFRVTMLESILTKAVLADGPVIPKEPADSLLSRTDIDEAIASQTIVARYQLKVDLRTGIATGCETLMRIAAASGLILPQRFIPTAEKSGQIVALTDLLVSQAFAEFGQMAPPHWTLSFNIAPDMLLDRSLPDRLAGIAAAHHLPPNRLIVEITETGVIGDEQVPLDVLSRLRIKGFQIAIDDYGTGYSSLSHLRRIPATEMKIDQVFIADMLRNEDSLTMVVKTVEMGRWIGLSIVAEGIESEKQQEFLAGLGCDIGQGYLFSRPVSLPEVKALADSRLANSTTVEGVRRASP